MPSQSDVEAIRRNIQPAREDLNRATDRDSEHARTETEVEYTGMFSIDLQKER